MQLVQDIQAKTSKGLCAAHGCKNKRCKNRSNLCAKHRRQDFKERYPLQYQFDILRTSAKLRHVPFNLTFDQFKRFCIRTKYMEQKGKYGDDMTIDRKNSKKGYQVGNLQLLTNSDNVRKQHKDRIRNARIQSWKEPPIDVSDIVRPVPVYDPDEQVPF